MDDALVGTKINRYELLECLDKTELIGYFKAYDTKLERNVIIKLVLHSINYSEEAVEYFLNESRTLAKLVHPNIAKVLDFGFENKNLYLISEYIPGVPLSTLMTGPMNWQRAAEILLPLTDALNYAHSKGVIHRDLKPENITVTDDGRLILNDFSLVKIIENEETRDMTGTKVGLGSPAYISPEQGKGLPADFRSDIYSLGVIFYEMVTGQKPFFNGNSMEIVIQHVASEPPRPKSIVPSLPNSIEIIILTALSKDIEKRYQSMQEFSNALQAALSGAPLEKTKQSARFTVGTRWAMVMASLLIIIAISGFSIWKFTQTPASSEPATPTSLVDTASSSLISPTSTSKSKLVQTATTQAASVLTVKPTVQAQSDAGLNPGIAVNDSSTSRRENTTINTVSFIDNGRMIIAGTSIGLYFYNTSDLTLKYFLDTKGPVSAIATSTDGAWIATGDQNGNVAVWNLQDGTEIARFEGHSGALVSLDISPDKTKLVSASGTTVYLWDINEKKSLFIFQKHAFPVNKVQFSHDGQHVISGGDDFQAMFWNVKSGEFEKKYSSTQKINDITISPDNTTMALALNNATIEIRDYSDGQIKKTFQDWKIIDAYKFSKFLPNNSLFATGSAEGMVRIWNISGNLIWQISEKNTKNNSLKSLSISDDGTQIATLSSDNLITVWDLPQQRMQASKNLANVPVPSTSVEKFAELVYSLPLIPVIAGAEIPEVSAPLEKRNVKDISELGRWGSPKINAISFIDNSQMILAATSAGVYFYNSTDLSLKYFFETNGWLSTFSVSDDGTWVATGAKNGSVTVWNIVDGKEIASFEGQPGEIISLAISPDKTLVAAVSDNKIISVWDFNQKQPKLSLRGHDLRVNKILFSPDGKYLISGGDDFQLIFWDVANGKPIKYPTGQKINDISISPDGITLALALNNSTIEVRNYKDGQIRKTFEDGKIVDAFKIIKFLPSNSLLVSGSENGIARVWNINGTSIWETPRQDKDGKTIEINSLKSISISDDGVRFVTLSDDNLINVWDINLKSLLVSRKLDNGSVQRISVSADNKMMAYQVGASSVELWSIENHKQITSLDGSLPRGYPFSSNNEFLVIQQNDTLLLYSVKSETPALLYTLYTVPPRGTVNYLLDDKIIAVFTNGILKYWSVFSGKELIPSTPVKYEGGCRVFYRDDGQFLAAGSVNGILHEETNAKYFCHISRGPRTISEDFLNDGSVTALSLENQALEIWEVQAGSQKISIKSQAKGNMLDVDISSDGKLLAAGSASGLIEIYDLATNELIHSFNAHTAEITQVLFTSDGKYIISASVDGTVRFWGIGN